MAPWIVNATLLLVAVVTAYAANDRGYRRGRADMKRELVPAPPVCACTHSKSMHGENGRCLSSQVPVKWDHRYDHETGNTVDFPVKWDKQPCACIRYMGPPDPYALPDWPAGPSPFPSAEDQA